MKKKLEKDVKMHKFLVCAYNSKDFAQTQENFARSHDRETVTFRTPASVLDNIQIFVCFLKTFLLRHKKDQ